ncbi:MAG: CPBP family intramembrane glutamic endopeptidase [Anaerolineae bacterium]|nr:CPBP family intramembrane metalloprotease [Anaerolineae bacterium]
MLTDTPKPRSLVVFFVLAFGISWTFWIPDALASYNLIPLRINSTVSGLLGAFGPFFATLIVTALYDGRTGFKRLLDRLTTWRVGFQGYLFVLLWPAILSLTKTGIAMLLGSPAPNFAQPPFLQLYPMPQEVMQSAPVLAFLPVIFLQQLLIGSSMGEEPGWRGYALPRLQAHRSSLRASLLLGGLWSIWHLPLWLTKGHPMHETFLGWAMLALVATTILFTWVYNHTKGSLWLALLFHASIAVTGLFLASTAVHPLVDVALNWGVAAVVIATCGAQRLTRGGLSLDNRHGL